MLLHCSMTSKPPVPMAIYKESDGESSDLCIPIMSLQAGQLVWNTRLAHFEPAFIQRYVYNGSPCAFIFRVTYQPTLNNFTYQIFQNVIPVPQSKQQFSQTLRYAFEETREGIRRKKARVVQLETDSQNCTPADRFCVATSVPRSFEVCPWPAIESVKAQIQTVKWILEKGYLSDYNLEVLELVVDFSQDKDKKWFMINVHSYKTELVVRKKINSSSLGKLIERLIRPVVLDIIRPKSENQSKKHSRRHLRGKKKHLLSFPRQNMTLTMMTTADSDLQQTMVYDVLRDIEKKPVKKKKFRTLSECERREYK